MINKFHISYNFEIDINFTSKLRFATRKHVEELILHCRHSYDPYLLPKFIFNNASLVCLEIVNCHFQLSWSINWPSLKILRMDGRALRDSQSIENVLSGSPSLESFKICNLYCDSIFTIASKSLKILILEQVVIRNDIEISCPNLEELFVKLYESDDHSIFPAKNLLHVLSGSPLLHSLELKNCFFHQLVIASKSLKRLVLHQCCAFEISCPNLERLDLCGSNIETCKSIFLPSPSCASLDFVAPFGKRGKSLARKVFEELQPIKELRVQNWFVKILPALEIGGLSYPLLNIKCLTLDCPNFKYISGILNLLRCSAVLERLVIKLHVYKYRKIAEIDLNNFEEIYRNLNGIVFTCLVSHLKKVKIIGLSKRDSKCKVILQFVEFVFKNARALEKMVVILEEGGMDFRVKVSKKLLGWRKLSQHAIVELL